MPRTDSCSHRARPLLPLVSLAALGLVVSLARPAAAVSPVPTDVPGLRLPSSPVTATIEPGSDAVFNMNLGAGDIFTANLSAGGGTDLDLYLFPPGSTSAQGTDFVASAETTSYPEVLSYVVPANTAGTYYLDVYAFSGSGDFSFTWNCVRNTVPRISATKRIVRWGGSSSIVVGLKNSIGVPVSAATATVESCYDGVTWKDYRAVKTSASGIATLSVTPTRRTYYRVRFDGIATQQRCQSGAVSVTPKLGLGTPVAPAEMTSGRAYSIQGSLRPRQTPGWTEVRIRVYHYENGAYVYKDTFTTKAYDNSTHSVYRGTVTLSTRGSWKLRAYTRNLDKYASTLSAADTVIVP